MSNKRTDEQLVIALQGGDSAAYEELLARYTPKAFSLATRLVKNREDAEEVLQDVFLTVFRKINGFEGKSSFSSWLYRITVNSSFMKLRKRKQNQRMVGIEDCSAEVKRAVTAKSVDAEGVDSRALSRQLQAALEVAVGKLPDEYRPVFILRDVDGLSSQEVSEILEISIPAVKSRLHRSRLMLRRKLLKLYRELNSDTFDQMPISAAG